MGDQAMMININRLERLDVPCIPLVRQRNSGEPVTDPAQFLAGIVRRQRMQMRRAEQQRIRQEQVDFRCCLIMLLRWSWSLISAMALAGSAPQKSDDATTETARRSNEQQSHAGK